MGESWSEGDNMQTFICINIDSNGSLRFLLTEIWNYGKLSIKGSKGILVIFYLLEILHFASLVQNDMGE